MRSLSSADPSLRRWRGLALSLLLAATVALAGCGGVILVIGGAAAGIVAATQGSSDHHGTTPGCGEIDATYVGPGPEGATILCIETAPDPQDPTLTRLFIGTDSSGVFSAIVDPTDPISGLTWLESGADLIHGTVLGVAASPEDRDLALAGTPQGLYQTLDGGATWGKVSLSPGDPEIRHVIFAPWGQGEAFASTPTAVYWSQDGGATWQEDQSASGMEVTGFAVLDVDELVAGTSGDGVWRRRATGGWFETDAQPGVQPPVPPILSIAVSPGGLSGGCVSPNVPEGVIYALTPDTVYQSSDRGQKWDDWAPDIDDNSTMVLLGFTCDHWIAVTETLGSSKRELMRSADDGVSWTPRIGPVDRVTALRVPREAPGTLFIGSTGQGIWWNSAEGDPASWESANEGLRGQNVLSLAVHPQDTFIAYAGTRAGGLLMTVDGGTTWTEVVMEDAFGNPLPFPIEIRAVTIHPNFPDTIFIGTVGAGAFEVQGGLLLPIPRVGGSIGGVVNAIALDSASGDLYVGFEDGVFVRPAAGSQLIRGQGAGVGDQGITSLAIDSSPSPAPSIAFVGDRSGDLFESTSGGSNWDRIQGIWPGSDVTALTVTREPDPLLYAAVEGAGIYRRPTAGGDWERSSTCLLSLEVRALTTSAFFPGRVLAATLDGLFRLDSPQETWKAIGGAEGGNPAYSVAVPSGAAVYAIYAGFPRGARRVNLAQ